MTLMISNGPSHLGPIFLWWFVFRFLVSSQTRSFSLNGVKVDFRRSIMRARASSCAANASSRFFISILILSSIAGYFVSSKDNGIAIGVSPNINSNGVFRLSACLRLLCVNSRVLSELSHSSGCEVQ